MAGKEFATTGTISTNTAANLAGSVVGVLTPVPSAVTRTAARAISKTASLNKAKSKIASIGKFQRHHVIPQELFNDKTIRSFLDDIGVKKNQSSNVISLPYDEKQKNGRSIHRGRHRNEYTESIRGPLRSIAGALRDGRITKEQATKQVSDLISRTRGNLRNDEIQLNKAGQRNKEKSNDKNEKGDNNKDTGGESDTPYKDDT